MKEKILLGMSGGTDSSVSAMMLKEQGYEVSGITFIFHEEASGLKAAEDAKALCKILEIQHHIYDARDVFRQKIISYFRDEYLAGRTPFPCAKCNMELKWNLIFSEADRLGCQKVAMGHYARIIRENDLYFIQEGIDPNKDQSFFLWGINRSFLPDIIFPLGGLHKTDVRKLANEYGFPTIAGKKDSLGACFCQGDYRPYLKSLVENQERYFQNGNYLDEKGVVLGQHQGYPLYTVGQRRGLGIHLNIPVFVKDILPEKNEIVLAPLKNMYRDHFTVNNYRIVDASLFGNDFDTDIRIRYRKQNNKGKITILDENRIRIDLAEPLESIAPGQTAVFYRDGKVLGGGFIE